MVATFGPIGLVNAEMIEGCGITECGRYYDTNCAEINEECVKGGITGLTYTCKSTGNCDAPIQKVSSGKYKLNEGYETKNAICFNPGEGSIPFSEKTSNSICVACSDESGAVKCIVDNFELPQLIDDGNFWNPLDWIKSTGDPKYLMFYEEFPDEESVGWQFGDTDRFAIAVIVIGGALNMIPMGKQAYMATGRGKALSLGLNKLYGEGYKIFAEKIIAKEITDDVLGDVSVGFLRKIMVKYALRKAVSHGAFDDVIVSGVMSKMAKNSAYAGIDAGSRKEIIEDIVELENSNLAGRMAKQERKFLESSIAHRYKGAGLTDVNFKMLQKEVSEEAIFVAGGRTLAQKAKDRLSSSIGNIFSSTGSRATATAVEQKLATESLVDFGWLGSKKYVATSSTELLSVGGEKKTLRLVDDMFAEMNTRFGSLAVKEGDKSIMEKSIAGTYDDGYMTIMNDVIPETIARKYVKEFGMESEEREFRRMVDKIYRTSINVDNQVSKGRVLFEFDEVVAKFMTKELRDTISGGHSIQIGMSPEVKAQVNKRIADAIRGDSDHTLAKGVMNSQAFWMTSTDMVGDMFPSEIDSDGVHVSTGNLFADGTKLVAGCKAFKKACIVAFAAGYVSLLAESISEPRTPIVGINSLGIKIPYVPLEEEQYSAKLSDAAFKYYLMISRGGLVTDPGPRLSMVSPCKATLTVEVREKPVSCYFDKCVVPDYMTEQIKSDCGGDRKCEKKASETYMADNCGYANPNNNIFSKTLGDIMDVDQSLRPKNQFFIFGEQLMEVKVHDEDMLKIDKFFPVDSSAGGVNYYRNLKDIEGTEGHYVDFGGYEELKNLRATKICNTQSAGALVGEEVLGAAWNTVTLDKKDYFSVTSYQISNVITVTADKQDYNGKSNYCYQTEKKVAAYGRLANMVVWTGLDIAVMGATAKFGPWGLAAAAGAHFITGSASVFVDQKLEDKSVTMWPGEI